MPTSEVDFLQELVKSLREENAALVELLITRESSKLTFQTEYAEDPNNPVAIGRIPWYRRQQELEKHFRKPKLSEISGITEEIQDAS